MSIYNKNSTSLMNGPEVTGLEIHSFGNDLERRASVPQSVESVSSSDPLFFRRGWKTEQELSEISKRSVARYHRKQNELIDSMLKPMRDHTEDARAEEKAAHFSVRIAVWASLLANIALSAIQLFAAITSGSLSFLATAIDSVFDPASNVVLFWLHKKAQRLDQNKWPVGGARLETVGNIVYGSLYVDDRTNLVLCSVPTSMASVNLVIIVESIRDIITHKGDELKEFHIPAVIAVAIALGTKLALFLYCYTIRKYSSQVQVLWEDHRNDLFINGFGLLMSAGGSNWAWFLDPMGALIIACGTITAWAYRIYREFELLTGKSAPREFIKLVTYKAMVYSEDIVQIDTVRAYHSGPDYIVEVDIVMDATAPLSKTHDVSQRLQDDIEMLPGVGRAFVHVDFETTHKPEHRKSN